MYAWPRVCDPYLLSILTGRLPLSLPDFTGWFPLAGLNSLLNFVPNKWFTFIHSISKARRFRKRFLPCSRWEERLNVTYLLFRSFCLLDSIFPVSPGGRGSLLSIISIPVLHQLQTLQHKSLVLLTLQVQPVVESLVEHFLLFFALHCFFQGWWLGVDVMPQLLLSFFLFLPFSYRPHFCSTDSTQLMGFLCVPHVKLNHLNLLFDFVPQGFHSTPK